jgi:dTDP-4-amino-4,6-dideoxygalactose transaminase
MSYNLNERFRITETKRKKTMVKTDKHEIIQLFRPVFKTNEILKEIKECLDKGWTGLGFKTLQLEENWKEYSGYNNAHYINSATSGLHLAINIFKKEFGWKDGDEIITSPLTFVSTNHAILYENMKPVFADIDQYLCLDPESVLTKISSKTRAIMFVGMGGSTGQYEKIKNIASENKLVFILDAAHMCGTRLNGKTAGLDSDVAIYSFQAVKNLPTADSGMICFAEKRLDEEVRKLSWLGINKDTFSRTKSKGAYKWKYDVDQIGFKYHGNSIMASIGIVQLKYLDIDNAYRRQVSKWYDTYFDLCENISNIKLPINCESSRHLYQIEVNNRDELLLALNRVNIFPGVHYCMNTDYNMFNYGKGTCPIAEYKSERLLSLPMHLMLSRNDIEYISKYVCEYSK